MKPNITINIECLIKSLVIVTSEDPESIKKQLEEVMLSTVEQTIQNLHQNAERIGG